MEQYVFTIGYIVVIMVIFYFLLIRPQKKKEKEKKIMLEDLGKRDEIRTSEGIYGRVVRIHENSVTIETGPDNVRIKLDKSAIADIIKKA
jgi:preprotein translocase subunit YajC